MDFTLVMMILGVLAGAACGILFGLARRAVVLDVLCALSVLYLVSLPVANHVAHAITGEYWSQHIESSIDTYIALSKFEDFVRSKLYFLAAAAMFAILIPAQCLGLWLFPATRAPFNPKSLRGIYNIIFRIGLVLVLGGLSAAFAQSFMAEFSRIEPGLAALAGKTAVEKGQILLGLLSSVNLTRFDLDGIWGGMVITPPLLYWIGVGCLLLLAAVGGFVWEKRGEIGQATNQGVEASLRGALKSSAGLRSWGAERLNNARQDLDDPAKQP